jgi:hypothetical protein
MTSRSPSRRAAVAFCLLAAVAIFAAGDAWAVNPFVDIAGNSHSNDIDAIYNAGITLGCSDATHYCPSDFVKRDQMASFLARMGGLSSGSTKNFPKVNAKGPTQAYCALNAANPASFKTGPCRTSAVTVDFGNTVGQFSSVATGSDGLPIISYFDNTNGDLRVTHCGSPSCSVGDNTVIVDSQGANSVGAYTSIAIGLDGLPIISYYDQTNGDLKVAHCGDVYCIFPNTITTVDTGAGAEVGLFTSITMGVDNSLPIISYFDQTNMALKVAHCTNLACTGVEITTVDNLVAGGTFTSITAGNDGLPIVSYRAGTELRVAHCDTYSCTGTRTISIVDSGGVGSYTSIAIGTDNLPIISYTDHTNGGLKVAHCVNATCTGSATITLLEPAGFTEVSTAIAIGADGLPLIAYLNSNSGQLRLAHCGTVACNGSFTATALDSPGPAGGFASIALGVDGIATVSYYEGGNGDLRVARAPLV